MKSWMGGRRRRITVARRDPLILQRQYFARRREERQQNARRAQARQSINSFRRQNHALADNSNEPTARTRPPPISTDFLLLANPSAMDSIANGLQLPKRQRIEDTRPQGRAHRERVRGEPAEEHDLEISNDIRIFDADGEKTQMFRKRTLPNDFLNSQTRVGNPRRGAQTTGDRLTDVKLDTGNWHRFSRNHLNQSANLPQLRRKPSPTWRREEDQEIGPSRRVRQRREASPSPIQMDQVFRRSDTAPRRVVTPAPSYHQIALSPDRLHRRTPSKRNRSPKSSSLDNSAIPNRFDPEEFVEATPSEEGKRDIYKDFLLGVSPSLRNEDRSRIPTAQKLLSTLTAITPHFPPIRIDSDDSETRTQYRSQQLKNKYEFRSLLVNEGITCEQFSADLKGFESNMLNIPDQDVPFLPVSKTAKDHRHPRYGLWRKGLSDESQFDQHKDATKKTAVPTFKPRVNITSWDKIPGFFRKPTGTPNDDAKMQSMGKNSPGNDHNQTPASERTCPSGMEIALTSAARNPVTLAADDVASEITMKD